jgi:hypothetical protein
LFVLVALPLFELFSKGEHLALSLSRAAQSQRLAAPYGTAAEAGL